MNTHVHSMPRVRIKILFFHFYFLNQISNLPSSQIFFIYVLDFKNVKNRETFY